MFVIYVHSVHLITDCICIDWLFLSMLDSNAVEQRNISVYRGESVTFTCNVSKTKVSQMRWTKGGSSFVFVSLNQTFSNFTSHRLTIDTNFPSKMNISNVQPDDAGIYRCTLYEEKRTRSVEWNLTVSEEHEGK